jgi:molybdopterin/thiamine biosynthesis adenylyltransferase
MEQLKSIASRISRGNREAHIITAAALDNWAAGRQVSPRQAMEAALTAGIFPECWERNFPGLSAAEQLRLFRSAVLVAGLGGLGGFLAELLARVGVGRLLLADGDDFTPANLNRQLLATRETLGLNKAVVTARRLREINPAILAEPIVHFLAPDNLDGYLSQVQVAVDGLDTIAARQELAARARNAGVPLVHGAVCGKFGQVSTLMPAGAAGGAVARHPALAQDAAPAREVLAPTVALVASLQVQEAIRLLLGQPPAYRDLLAHFDGDTGRLEILPLGLE